MANIETERLKDHWKVKAIITKNIKLMTEEWIPRKKGYDRKYYNNNVIGETRTYFLYPLRFLLYRSLILFIPWVTVNSWLYQYLSLYHSTSSIFYGSSEYTCSMIWTLTYPKGEVEYRQFSLKHPEVPQWFFFVFLSLFCILNRNLRTYFIYYC